MLSIFDGECSYLAHWKSFTVFTKRVLLLFYNFGVYHIADFSAFFSVGRGYLENCSEPRRNFYTVLCRKYEGIFALNPRNLNLYNPSYEPFFLPVMSDYWSVMSVNPIRQTMWLDTLSSPNHFFPGQAWTSGLPVIKRTIPMTEHPKHTLKLIGNKIQDATWNFQQCGMCDHQNLRSSLRICCAVWSEPCAYVARSDQSLAHMRSQISAFASRLNILWV